MSALKEQTRDLVADPFTTLLPEFSVQEFWTDSTKTSTYSRGFGNVEKAKATQQS